MSICSYYVPTPAGESEHNVKGVILCHPLPQSAPCRLFESLSLQFSPDFQLLYNCLAMKRLQYYPPHIDMVSDCYSGHNHSPSPDDTIIAYACIAPHASSLKGTTRIVMGNNHCLKQHTGIVANMYALGVGPVKNRPSGDMAICTYLAPPQSMILDSK